MRNLTFVRESRSKGQKNKIKFMNFESFPKSEEQQPSEAFKKAEEESMKILEGGVKGSVKEETEGAKESEKRFGEYDVQRMGKLYGLDYKTQREEIESLLEAKEINDKYEDRIREKFRIEEEALIREATRSGQEPRGRFFEENRRILAWRFQLPENASQKDIKKAQAENERILETDPKGFSKILSERLKARAAKIKMLESKERTGI